MTLLQEVVLCVVPELADLLQASKLADLCLNYTVEDAGYSLV